MRALVADVQAAIPDLADERFASVVWLMVSVAALIASVIPRHCDWSTT